MQTKEYKIHSGWAFASNAKELSKENQKNYKNILDEIGGHSSFELSKTPGYNQISYVLKPLNDKANNLTSIEAALIADNGNLCFGGVWRKSGNNFCGTIYTD